MVAAQAVEGWRLRGRGSDERGPELALSPDQLIRPLHQGRWERQVQLPGDLMFTTSSNWSAARPEVGGLGTLEDLVHKGGGATIDIARLCSVGKSGHQQWERVSIHCRQSVLSRQVGKQLCLSVEVWAHRHDERFGAFFPRWSNATSKSLPDRASTNWTFKPRDRAVSSASFTIYPNVSSRSVPGCERIATLVSAGMISFRGSSRLGVSLGAISVRPVMFPP